MGPYHPADLRRAILDHLGRKGLATIAALARELGRDRNAVNRQVAELEVARVVTVDRNRGNRGSQVSCS